LTKERGIFKSLIRGEGRSKSGFIGPKMLFRVLKAFELKGGEKNEKLILLMDDISIIGRGMAVHFALRLWFWRNPYGYQ
jgi:hypothetical protein